MTLRYRHLRNLTLSRTINLTSRNSLGWPAPALSIKSAAADIAQIIFPLPFSAPPIHFFTGRARSRIRRDGFEGCTHTNGIRVRALRG